jgi:chromosome segregation ATPase
MERVPTPMSKRDYDDPEVARMLQSIAETRHERDDLRRLNETLDRELAIAKSAIDRLEHEKEQLHKQRDDAIAKSAALLAGYKAGRAAIEAARSAMEANDPEPKAMRLIGSPRRNGPAPTLDRLEADIAELTTRVKPEPEPAPEAPGQ